MTKRKIGNMNACLRGENPSTDVLHPIVKLTVDGKPYVMVPADQARVRIGEDAADRALLERAAAESAGHDMIPGPIAERLFAGESPIKVLREWRGWNQSELAAAADITQGYLSEIESGKGTASGPTYRRLAAVLRVALDMIMPEETLSIWKLTPRELGDDDWRASGWTKPVIVRAPSEKAARWAASFEFHDATKRGYVGQRLPMNPWRQERLVKATKIEGGPWSATGPIELLDPPHHSDAVSSFDWSGLK